MLKTAKPSKKRPKTENRQKTALKKAKNRKPPKNRPKKGQKPKTVKNCGFKAKNPVWKGWHVHIEAHEKMAVHSK